MDELSTSSAESEAQAVRFQMDGLPDLYKQIQQLLCTTLSEHSFMVRQEELRIMQRSSFYLEIRRYDHHENTQRVSDTKLWSLLDKQRQRSIMTLAYNRVELLLALQELLYEELIEGCKELKAFVDRYDQGLADGDAAAQAQQRFLRTHQDLKDFESRMTRDAAKLYQQNQCTPNDGHPPGIPLSISLIIKMPVMINRLKSRVTSNVVHLYWEVADMQSEDQKQMFQIQIKCLPQTCAEQEDVYDYTTCQQHYLKISDLKPKRDYEFSVRRLDRMTLVREKFVDTISLRMVEKDAPVST
ncbi:fibronectin type III domain-containing protein 11-like isoform X2 [Clinocottus analis]